MKAVETVVSPHIEVMRQFDQTAGSNSSGQIAKDIVDPTIFAKHATMAQSKGKLFNWHDVAPLAVAIGQLAWERRQLIQRMSKLGFTYKQIGRRLVLSEGRVGLLARRAKRFDPKSRCPIEVWADKNNAARDLITATFGFP
jgi:hypothetical protein